MPPEVAIMTDADVERFASEKDEGLGALVTDKGPLPHKALDVLAQLEGLIAEVSLTQVFVNNHAEPLEATYIFPLPDRAAVTAFRLEVAGRVVGGVLRERAAARREYEESLKAGHRAAIAEEERPGVFTLRVGNLPAGESATVRLTMVGPLLYEGGEVTFRFPLVVAPRFIPGTPLEGRSVGAGVTDNTDAVPDASRITPPLLLPGNPVSVRFSLQVIVQAAGLPIEDFRSSLHAIGSEQTADGATRLTVHPGERLNRDFILRYRIGEETLTTSLTVVPDATGDEGTFVLTVVPPVGGPSNKQQPGPREVIFLLDRSGSMAGWKMAAARRALARMIDALTSRDRFAVLAFDDEVEIPALCAEGSMPASDRNRFRAIEWLAGIDARGGTELAQPLEHAAVQLADCGNDLADRILVLLTDGQVGNEDRILQALAQRLKGIRIFTLGIDRAVNEAFLRRLAALGGGSCDVVESVERLDEVMEKVQRRIGTPLLTGLQMELVGTTVERDSQVPARLPDLFAGTPLAISGRYRRQAPSASVLHAIDDAGRPVKQSVFGRVSTASALPKIWARGRLRELEDRWVIGGDESPAQLQEKIVALSLQFGVMCRFTAFVAVDRSETANEGGKQQQLVQPVELPDGWEMPTTQVSFGPRARGLATKFLPGFVSRLASSPAMDYFASSQDTPGDCENLCSMEMASEEERHDCQDHWDDGLAQSPPSLPSMPTIVEEEIDLAAYRSQAKAMLQALRADRDAAHALGVLALKLQALVEDLKSIGISAADLAPLADLLENIRQLSLPTSATQLPPVVGHWIEQAEKVLEAFAGEPAAFR
jgi:Ca-activated chloride channel homolog